MHRCKATMIHFITPAAMVLITKPEVHLANNLISSLIAKEENFTKYVCEIVLE